MDGFIVQILILIKLDAIFSYTALPTLFADKITSILVFILLRLLPLKAIMIFIKLSSAVLLLIIFLENCFTAVHLLLNAWF